MIFAALLLYLALPIIATILIQRKMDEGRIWLLVLLSALLAFIFLMLRPVASVSETSNRLWFTSNSLILTSNSRWSRAEWLIQLLIGLFIIIRLAVNYLRRAQKPFAQYETWILCLGAALGITALQVNHVFLLVIGWALLDGLQVARSYFEEKEIFKSRREVLALLLRLVSILMVVFISILSEAAIPNPRPVVVISLVVLVVVLRLLAVYLDQLSANHRFQMNTDWMLYLNILFLVRLLSLLGMALDLTGSTYLFFYLPIILVTGVFIFYLFKKKNPALIKFNLGALVVGLALCFSLSGSRQELLFLLLPLFFLLLNEQLSGLPKGYRIGLVLFEMIFMVGYTFSPLYALNVNVIDSTIRFPFQYILLGVEGFLLAGFLVNQQFNPTYPTARRQEMGKSLTTLGGLVIFTLTLSILRGFFNILLLGQVSWRAFVPLAVAGLIFGILQFFPRAEMESKSGEAVPYFPSKRWIDGIFHVVLVLVNLLQQLFEGITSILEGDGGLIWAIVFVILLLTLYKGITQA